MKTLLTLIATLIVSVAVAQKTTIKLQIKDTNIQEVSRVMVQQLTSAPYPDSVSNPLYTGIADKVNKPRIINPETASQMFERVLREFVNAVYKTYKKEQTVKAVADPVVSIY